MEKERALYSLVDLSSCFAELEDKNVVIFGAGMAGKQICCYLQERTKVKRLFFCDNNRIKQDENLTPPVYSLERASKIQDAIYLVGFIRNAPEKIQSAVECLSNAGITMQQIRLVDMNIDYLDSICGIQMQRYIDSLIKENIEKESIRKVRTVKFLTYGFNADKEINPGGGPIGAICMQKKCLGAKFEQVNLEYPYYITKEEIALQFVKFPFIMGAVAAVRQMFSDDVDTIYIANDIFSAFGLYTLGKNYCLLFHAQGDVVKEMTLWGHKFSEIEKELIYRIEKLAVENAYQVLFPSKGAEIYFRESFEEKLIFQSGKPMYNTVIDFPIPEEVEGIESDSSCITFFSIGQMTRLKGMDRIPAFLQQFMDHTNMRVRWIVVADGVLKEEVRRQAEELCRNTGRFEYINIDYKISHAQIFYLMNLCDVYIMLHRVSIFDFSTLEAMCCEKPIILSDIPGNDEYDKENNIMLVKDNMDWNQIVKYVMEGQSRGQKNRAIYQKYFDESRFVERYRSLLAQFIKDVEARA